MRKLSLEVNIECRCWSSHASWKRWHWVISNVFFPTSAKTKAKAEYFTKRTSKIPTWHAKERLDSVLSAFKLILDQALVEKIVTYTEMEAERRGYHDFTTSTGELYCFIGILLARGVAAKGVSLKDLWNQTWGISFFAKSMSSDRFLLLLKLLRFDYKATRRRRLAHNKFALVSEIWQKFVQKFGRNCQICYSPRGYITVDEQLFPSKVRCRFILLMPEKPDKYGIKFWLAVDCELKYFLNGFTY